MSKSIVKEIAKELNKEELIKYYETHLPKDVAEHFGFDQKYFIRLFDYMGIKRRTASENSKIQAKYYFDDSEEAFKRRSEAHKKGYWETMTEETRKSRASKISSTQKEHIADGTVVRKATTTSWKKGSEPWNKGLTKDVDERVAKKPETIEKWLNTMASLKKETQSKLEDRYYENVLIPKYGEGNVIRHYKDERYFYIRKDGSKHICDCDFYIPSEDLFIELQGHQSHGTEPFEPENPNHIELLQHCKDHPEEWLSEGLINIWAGRDYQKRMCFINNNLNYLLVY